jgi:uncharacterized membrane protein
MNLSQIRREADQHLRENGNYFPKLVLIHTIVTAGASLLLMLINWLSQYIAPDGGLSNMGTQDLLSTCQILLQLISMLAVPFWDAGLIYCALRLIQGQRSTSVHLAEGFRRWGPIASSLLIRGLIYYLVCSACLFGSSLILSALPLPSSIISELSAFIEAPNLPLSGSVRIFMVTFAVIYLINLCVLLVPRLYLHRQVVYRIMDTEPCNGLQAVLHSRILMKGHRRKLLLLDLSFWWFYALDLGISMLSMSNLILEELGIVLPIESESAAWLFPIIALLARIGLYFFAQPKLSVSYGLFYQQAYEDSLKEPEPPAPKKMPWKY